MALLKSAKQLIVEQINIENQLALKTSDLVYFVPRAPLDEEIAIADGKNTALRVAASATAPAKGAMVLYYDRLSFDQVFTGIDGIQPLTIPVDFTQVTDTYGCIPALNQYYGLTITENDLVNHPVDVSLKTFVLEAAAGSLGWIGSINGALTKGDAALESNFTQAETSSFTLPQSNQKLGQAAVYSYPLRLTSYADQLVTAGANLTLAALAGYLKAVSGDAWAVARNPANFNLKESKVVYNGANNQGYPTNPNFSHVVVVQLSSYCLNLGGTMYLHYNKTTF